MLNPPPDLIEGEEEYEVEKITHHKVVRRQMHYLVTSKGYPLFEKKWMKEDELGNAKKILIEYKIKKKLLRPDGTPK